MNVAAVVLAAGQGVRMRSDLPKVLHPIAGRPMVRYALAAVHAVGTEKPVLVVGRGGDQVRSVIGSEALFVEQKEQEGTGHAVLQARGLLQGRAEAVLVTYADMPLLEPETLRRLVDRHGKSAATITMLTVRAQDPMGFGRILRDRDGNISGIVEESEATPEQLAIRELNCGVYCFKSDWLWEHLPELKPSAKKGEYYLTDLIALAVGEGCPIESVAAEDETEVIGINTRVHLARVERIVRQRINQAMMEAGVTLIDPAMTYVDADVQIGPDTIVEPNAYVRGQSRIGSHCVVGANTVIRDSEIGDECEIVSSAVEEAVLESRVHVGPFAHLRPGTHLCSGVYVGNHTEIKNSRLGEKVRVGHFSYIGDSEVGARTNIGAGAITCNFDGKTKHRTVIGEDVFIGSDTLLRAPVTIGDRATTGAGSVVTKDVPADSVAVGAPARVIRKLE